MTERVDRLAVKRHGEFVMRLGERLIGRYSDGSASLHRVDRRKGKAARKARRNNRWNNRKPKR